MEDQQLLRYSRHILLDDIGVEGQQRLSNSRVAIIGLGGLGCPAAQYLAASGIGHLTLCDFDVVEDSNLQRQILFDEQQIQQTKAAAARQRLQSLNSSIAYQIFSQRADAELVRSLAASHDVILDCSDNFETRYLLNKMCLLQSTALVSGAAVKFDGLLTVFDFRENKTGCYNCLFPEDSAAEELRCATTGIFSPLVGLIGTLQAAEAIKLLIGLSSPLTRQLLSVNALDMRFIHSGRRADPDCAICA